jgi:hypothetical protein
VRAELRLHALDKVRVRLRRAVEHAALLLARHLHVAADDRALVGREEALRTVLAVSDSLKLDGTTRNFLGVVAKNRRLGLGLMGLHEFLAVRGLKYEPSKWLGEYLVEYANSGEYAKKYAIQHGLSVPVATRAIAPTGTIAIVAETTTGIEPIFCVAYKRRYLDAGKVWKFQYVIDPTARSISLSDTTAAAKILKLRFISRISTSIPVRTLSSC